MLQTAWTWKSPKLSLCADVAFRGTLELCSANLTEGVQADNNNMDEEIRMAEQGDAANSEPSVDMSNNSPTKRARGRPQGSKKLKVCVTNVNLMGLVSGISNGGSTQPQRRRGRPKLSGAKHSEQQESGDNSIQTPRGQVRLKASKKQPSEEDRPMADHSPKKRGRPKKSLSKSTHENADAEDLPNGGSDTPKMGRGRPKGSKKRKSESLTSGEENEGGSVIPRKRGRPKGSVNNTTKLEREVSSEGEAEADGTLNLLKRGRGRPRKMEVNNTGESTQDTSNGISKTLQRGRGRPKKHIEQESRAKQELATSGSPPAKRGRGRPKGSLNKKPPAYKELQSRRAYAPPTKGKRGRPRKKPTKRGRPRKYPLPSPEELKRPKVWKPLGRPRKYPRVDPPEGALPAPRRSRGRPRKSESKKGAHLRKSWPTSSSSPRNPNDGSPRKRGRPPSTPKSEEDTPRKRGRPKGSLNKNKARSETQLDSTLPDHSKSDSSVSGVEHEGESSEQEHKTDTVPIENRSDNIETLDWDVGFNVSKKV
uniref:serine/arginine repetitive matrix protein 1-like isoform X1 n=2 Tax=Scatophagus argus TaxID=75038 RepID=UPI001ED81A74|nr:serine/arginine repetitive matrix protein 1-like isoform X1 [Scatophagus argus]